MKTTTPFPALLQVFFTDRLMRQQQVSANTITSYRDAFRLLLGFAQKRLGKTPSTLTLEELNAPFVAAFLDYLEKDRGNCARSRNARLAAIHSFFRYIAFQEPTHSAMIQRVLAMPSKRYDRRTVVFLNRLEIDAILVPFPVNQFRVLFHSQPALL